MFFFFFFFFFRSATPLQTITPPCNRANKTEWPQNVTYVAFQALPAGRQNVTYEAFQALPAGRNDYFGRR